MNKTMHRIIIVIAIITMIPAYATLIGREISNSTVVNAEHNHPEIQIPADAIQVFEFPGDNIVTPEEAMILRPDLFTAPELAKSCYISPQRGSWAKGTCQAYSGTGSRGFQLIGWA